MQQPLLRRTAAARSLRTRESQRPESDWLPLFPPVLSASDIPPSYEFYDAHHQHGIKEQIEYRPQYHRHVLIEDERCGKDEYVHEHGQHQQWNHEIHALPP